LSKQTNHHLSLVGPLYLIVLKVLMEEMDSIQIISIRLVLKVLIEKMDSIHGTAPLKLRTHIS